MKINEAIVSVPEPVEYVRRILKKMAELNEGDGAGVDFSARSDGHPPNYRIFVVMDPEHGGAVVGAYDGRTHRDMSYDRSLKEQWSDEWSTFQDVQDVLGRLRGFAKRPLQGS